MHSQQYNKKHTCTFIITRRDIAMIEPLRPSITCIAMVTYFHMGSIRKSVTTTQIQWQAAPTTVKHACINTMSVALRQRWTYTHHTFKSDENSRISRSLKSSKFAQFLVPKTANSTAASLYTEKTSSETMTTWPTVCVCVCVCAYAVRNTIPGIIQLQNRLHVQCNTAVLKHFFLRKSRWATITQKYIDFIGTQRMTIETGFPFQILLSTHWFMPSVYLTCLMSPATTHQPFQ